MSPPSPPPSPSPSDSPVDPRVHLALAAVQVAFGGFHVVAKWTLDSMEPFALVGLRVGMAAPILAGLAAATDRTPIRPRHLPWLAGLGLLGVFGNQLLFVLGLERTTATNAAILMPSVPVFAVALGMLAGVERVGRRRVAGVALAAVGALVMVDPFQIEVGGGTLAGNAMILGNCLCYAAFLVFQRPLLERLPWRTVIAGAFVFGGASVVAVTWREVAVAIAAPLPATVWLGIAYIVLFPTVLSYSLNTWAVRRSSPSLTAVYITLQPVVTATLAALFLGESIGWGEVAGFALIVGGLVTVSRRRR